MQRQFTGDEIQELVRMARTYAPSLSVESFHALVESQSRLGDSRLLEAAWALTRLEQELGAPCHRALDRYREITAEISDLETAVGGLRQQQAQLEAQTKTARTQLQKVLSELRRAEETVRGAEKEEERLQASVERARHQARVSQEEVVAAKALKAEVRRRGLDLSHALDMLQGFPEEEQDGEHVAVVWMEYGSLMGHTVTLKQEAEELEGKMVQLRGERQREEKGLYGLRREAAQEREIHGFYQRFRALKGLMEYLAGWQWVAFRRCSVCGARFWAERREATGPAYFQKGYFICPCCGSPLLACDEYLHVLVGWPTGTGAVSKIVLEQGPWPVKS